MNPLNDYPKVREVLYVVQFLASLVMGVLGIVLAAQGDGVSGLPSWYVTAGLVLSFVWSYLGLTAKQNVQTQP
jgi:hypothetical protein